MSEIQNELDRLKGFFAAQKLWRKKLESLAGDLAQQEFELELDKDVSFGAGQGRFIAEVSQEIDDTPSDPDQKAELGGRAGGVVIRTRFLLDVGADKIRVGPADLGFGGRVGLTIEVPAAFAKLGVDQLLDENAARDAVAGQVAIVRDRIKGALVMALAGDEDRVRGLPRGTRFAFHADLEGQVNARGAAITAELAAATRLRASYQAGARGLWKVSIDQPSNLEVSASGKLPVADDFEVAFEAKAAVLRRRAAAYRVDVNSHAAALVAALPGAQIGGELIPRVDGSSLDAVGIPAANTFEVILEADYGGELSGSVHPAVSLGASFARKTTRRVTARCAYPEGRSVDHGHELALAALDVEAASVAREGSRVVHLVKGAFKFAGEVSGGRSLDLGGLLDFEAAGTIGLETSRNTYTSLSVDWPEAGRPVAELEEHGARELAASIALTAGATLQKEARAQLESQIADHLADWNYLDMVDKAGESGLDALEKAIAEYLNVSLELGFSRARSRRHTIVCGPFDLTLTEHQEAFAALRRDYNVAPAIRAGLVQVRQLRRERVDESRFSLDFLGLLQLDDTSRDAWVGQKGEFDKDGVTGSFEGVQVRGRETARFDVIGRRRDEATTFEWNGASVILRRSGAAAPARRLLLHARGTLEDGEVQDLEARRWRILLEELFPKVQLLSFEEGRGSSSGEGTLAFQLNARGLRNLADLPLGEARRVFLSHAVRVEGAPGPPLCALPDRVPVTWRMADLARWDDSQKAAEAYRAEYGSDVPAGVASAAYQFLGAPGSELAADSYRAEFGGTLEHDLVRYHSIDLLREFAKHKRDGQHVARRRAAREYVRATGRDPARFDPAFGQSSEVAATDYRILEQSDLFIDTLFDVQRGLRRAGDEAADDTELHRRLFERFSDLAHRVTPSALVMGTSDRVQAYVTVHALTLLGLAGLQGYSVSEFAYESSQLSFEAVKRPVELDLDEMIEEAGAELGVQL